MFGGSSHDVTNVEEIEAQFEPLSPEDLAQIRDWLLERDWAEWDRQIKVDAAAGKLEKLFEKAEADHRAGKSTEL